MPLKEAVEAGFAIYFLLLGQFFSYSYVSHSMDAVPVVSQLFLTLFLGFIFGVSAFLAALPWIGLLYDMAPARKEAPRNAISATHTKKP
jgi:predicted MFS family arabinose efflux permease